VAGVVAACPLLLSPPAAAPGPPARAGIAQAVAAQQISAVQVAPKQAAAKARPWRPLLGTRADPHHWSACTLTYQVNPAGMPRRGLADVREALRRVSAVTRVVFTYAGETQVVPDLGYDGPAPGRFVVAWSHPLVSGLLEPATAGRAATLSDDQGRIVTGYVVINADWAARAPAGFGAGQPHGAVLMHELGHLLGLGHVADPGQLMKPSATHPAAVWGAGDRRGLRRLATVMGCLSP
jgi:hypothetical protein